MKPTFDKTKMLYTDSFFYEMETDDLYVELKQLSKFLDTSNYPSTHFLYNAEYKKVVG